MRRTPDTPGNNAAYGRIVNGHNSSEWPQLRMVCQIEVTSRLLTGRTFGSISAISEVDLAAQLAEQMPDHVLPLMDKGFYTPELLYHWQSSGTEKHWLTCCVL